jgi:hypothetical protein
MATENLIKTGTATVWADTTDYSSTVSGLVRTDQIDLTSLAAAAARQGAKADLGATRAAKYNVLVAVEFVAASGTLSGESVDLYLAWSPITTAANANPGGVSGSDAAYTGTAGDSLADSLKQLERVGSLITTTDNTTVVQYQKVGEIFATGRYVSPVLVNNATGAFVADAVEMYIALEPIIDEFQA